MAHGHQASTPEDWPRARALQAIGLESAPLARLPIVTKDALMESFDEVVTTPGLRLDAIREFAATMSATDLFAGRYHVVATSGTTGNRGFFVFTKDEWRTLAMASVARGVGWSGHDPRASGRGVVMASTIPWHVAGIEVKQWQLRVRPDGLSIACVCEASEFQEADALARLDALPAASGAEPLAIRASHVDRLERTPTGKAKLVTTLTR